MKVRKKKMRILLFFLGKRYKGRGMISSSLKLIMLNGESHAPRIFLQLPLKTTSFALLGLVIISTFSPSWKKTVCLEIAKWSIMHRGASWMEVGSKFRDIDLKDKITHSDSSKRTSHSHADMKWKRRINVLLVTTWKKFYPRVYSMRINSFTQRKRTFFSAVE